MTPSRMLAAALLALALPAGAAVTVSFVEPDGFTDTGRWAADRARTLADLEEHLVKLGRRHLAPGDDVAIEILDVDLAGRVSLGGRLTHDIRIVEPIDWPKMRLRYTRKAAGAPAAPVTETLSDPDFLRRVGGPYSADALKYEKRMLDAWFVSRFAGVAATR